MRWHPDVALDMGTALTRAAAASGRGFAEAPSRAAVVGGAVVDAEAAAAVAGPLLSRLGRLPFARPRVLACAHSDASAEERERLALALALAGAEQVAITPEPLAAAIGAGLEVGSRHAGLVVDLGEGVTDCAVVRAGRIEMARALRRGCFALRQAVIGGLGARRHLMVSAGEAERLVREVGVRPRLCRGARVAVAGTGTAGAVRRWLPAGEVNEPLVAAAGEIAAAVGAFVRDLPLGLGSEVVEGGLTLTGGGALVPGMPERLRAATGLDVRVAPHPLHAVLRGARSMLATAARTRLWDPAG